MHLDYSEVAAVAFLRLSRAACLMVPSNVVASFSSTGDVSLRMRRLRWLAPQAIRWNSALPVKWRLSELAFRGLPAALAVVRFSSAQDLSEYGR